MPRPGGGTVIVMTVPLLPNTAFWDIADTHADELNTLVLLLKSTCPGVNARRSRQSLGPQTRGSRLHRQSMCGFLSR